MSWWSKLQHWWGGAKQTQGRVSLEPPAILPLQVVKDHDDRRVGELVNEFMSLGHGFLGVTSTEDDLVVVTLSGAWTQWEQVTFSAPDLLQALQDAAAYHFVMMADWSPHGA